MKLAYWMYAGPAHIGTLRVASSFQNVHAIMHAPLGDDYFNVMRSMLEREKEFTPVTASIVDRHVLARGSQEKVVNNITRKDQEEHPDLILLTPTCTSSILQEDLQNFADRASTESTCDVILADVNHYRVNEFQAADRTLEQIIRAYTKDVPVEKTIRPSCNLIGFFTLGFHQSHDANELTKLLNTIGIDVNLILPEDRRSQLSQETSKNHNGNGTRVKDLQKIPQAWFNVVPYREIGLMTAQYLEKEFDMPFISITPMGVLETKAFLYEVAQILQKQNFSNDSLFQLPPFESSWFARSIDCQNLTGKKACVFGDATHAVAMTKILVREMGIDVICVGTYCKHDAEWFREQIETGQLSEEILITDQHTEVAEMIRRCQPDAIFGTQMERHIGKRLGIPCGVISAPVHIQNFPLGYRPFLGIEGTHQIADLIYNSFTLGMEDHLLEIFGGHDTALKSFDIQKNLELDWEPEAKEMLMKIPGFVRKKIQKNTEAFATQQNQNKISLELFYLAKEELAKNQK